jgi:predicted transcriptional regulator YdeE
MDNDIEIFELEKDIILFYVEADSFPEGIGKAWDKLHSIVKEKNGRKFYGISFGSKDNRIIYRAATEEIYPGEAEKYKCDTFTLKKGQYKSRTVKDFMNNLGEIPKIFEQLKKEPDIDPQGYCAEIYEDDSELKCMIKLK